MILVMDQMLFPTSAYLTKVRPDQNMRRFYGLCLQPDLFGGCTLIKRWGRMGGQGGMVKSVFFEHEGQALDALCEMLRVKQGRGYVFQEGFV